MFLTGLSIWVHGVSALNCGAMFFYGLCPFKTRGTGPGALWLALRSAFSFSCLFSAFSGHPLMQARNFSQEELAVFHNLFDLRWAADYSNSGSQAPAFADQQKRL